MQKRIVALLLSLVMLLSVSMVPVFAEAVSNTDNTDPGVVESAEPSAEKSEPAPPIEDPEPQPTESADPQPTESEDPQPIESAEPQPTESADPQPTESEDPQPTESADPQPTESVDPQPTESAEPQPTESADPQPTESADPQPTESADPQPTESVDPQPTESADPQPTEIADPLVPIAAAPEELLTEQELDAVLYPDAETAQQAVSDGSAANAASMGVVQDVESSIPVLPGSTVPENGEETDEVSITLSGSLPAGAYVVAYPVTVQMDDVAVLAAYDITIYRTDGTTFQPDDGSVGVNIVTPALNRAKAVDVYHIADSDDPPAPADAEPDETAVTATVVKGEDQTAATATRVAEAVEAPAGQVQFDAESFSIYVLADNSTSTNQIRVTEGSTTLQVGETIKLYADNPHSTVRWRIVDGSVGNVASVSSGSGQSATLTGLNPGTATVRYEYQWGSWHLDSTLDITVTPAPTLSAHTVDTVDTSSVVTMRMFDFDSPTALNNALGNRGKYTVDSTSGDTKEGLLNASAVFDSTQQVWYPTTVNNGSSLKTWFNKNSGTSVNHLFLQDTYDDTGYYYYNSAENFAHLESNGDFTVYDLLGTPRSTEDYYFQRGNFMPYNSLNASSVLNHNLYNYLGSPLTQGDARYNEPIYGFNETTDYAFGMYMESAFQQPKNGRVNGDEMVFEFTGDDDMWIYIDGALVLDLGGIHDAQSGSINFTTGQIMWTDTPKGKDAANYTHTSDTLRSMFTAAGKDVSAFNGNTFGNYTKHTIQMFYMERGGGASNLRVRFNLPVIPSDSLTVTKQVQGVNSGLLPQQTYTMQLAVSGRAAPYTYKIGDTTYQTDSGGTFSLKDDQTAVFPSIPDSAAYTVKELNTGGYDVAFAGGGGTPAAGTLVGTTASSPSYSADTVRNVVVTNTANNTGTLTVTKAFAGEPEGGIDDFSAVFKLYLAGSQTPVETVNWSAFTGGAYTFQNLLPGDYYVLETGAKAYESYQLTTTYQVGVGGAPQSDGTQAVAQVTSGADAALTVTNDYELEGVYELPIAGGAGTVIFRVAGLAILVAGAAALGTYLVHGKRKKK